MGSGIHMADTYSLKYQFHGAIGMGLSQRTRLRTLLERYVNILWEPGLNRPGFAGDPNS